MSVRSRMVHRADIWRDANLGNEDAWNNPVAPSPALLTASQPCYLYQPRMGGEQQGDRNVNIYTWQMLAPSDIAVTEKDQIRNVRTRIGDEITSHVFNIIQIVRKPQHKILTLEAVSSGAT
jgi:hypothetical protein